METNDRKDCVWCKIQGVKKCYDCLRREAASRRVCATCYGVEGTPHGRYCHWAGVVGVSHAAREVCMSCSKGLLHTKCHPERVVVTAGLHNTVRCRVGMPTQYRFPGVVYNQKTGEYTECK